MVLTDFRLLIPVKSEKNCARVCFCNSGVEITDRLSSEVVYYVYVTIERCKFSLVVIPSPFSSIVSPLSVNHLNSLEMCSGDRDNTLRDEGDGG